VRRAGAAGLAIAFLVGGCGLPDVAGLPLPGGAPSGDGYRVTVEFADVLDLVPQAAVKVNDVTVGSVERISLSGWTARVRLRIGTDVRLPQNADAAVRQTSLLGEKYVALEAPTTESPRGALTDGSVIPLARTRRGAEVEEVLAAFGLLLNGGGLAQLKTINDELASALDGRETQAKDALHQLDTFLGGLDQQKADIVRAVDALDRLTGHLAQQRDVIGTGLDSLAPGLTVLEDQRRQLTVALTSLGDLGRVGTRVVNASRDDTLAVLRSLRPILEQLVKSGDALPKALDFMLTYPFPPNVSNAIVGDFVNLGATADLDATTILSNLLVTSAPPPPASAADPARRSQPGRKSPATAGKGATKPGVTPSGVLPLPCLPISGILPPGWKPPSGCSLPKGCALLPPGTPRPPGSLLPPAGVVPPGTVFPPRTVLPPGTALSPGCLLAPVTGAVTGRRGPLPDLLNGGLLP
jgi:phospholipid/cholesterol/gamma-HCH transport system substrate-binding protein